MKYIALLRGINVGNAKRVEMKRLKTLFESLGYNGVQTYINSGNISFESNKTVSEISKEIDEGIKAEFGFGVPTLVKTENEMKIIADSIPAEWKNDTEQKTDVAYLFEEIDTEDILDKLPIKKEYISIYYISGALVWNVSRRDYNKSHLNKLISDKFYQLMTVRNVNTARFLANMK